MENSNILKSDLFEQREYQKAIADNASKKNTLVVLPTGMGKTLIAVLVAAKRLEQFPDRKILITAPTRPLNAQHKKSFEKYTTISEEEIILVTGKINPEDRSDLYKKARIIVATPQTIRNDLENNRLNLENFSFVVFDEAHRSVKDYAYPYIAKRFMLQSKYPLILGLTASPGGSSEKIEEITSSLFIRYVEIRSEADEDVEKYIKPIDKEFIYVEFPEEFRKIKLMIKEMLDEELNWLRQHHYLPPRMNTKRDLLVLQKRIGARYSQGSKSYSMIWAMIKSAEAIKLEHALELLETQGISFLYDYLERIRSSKKKVDQRIIKDPRMREAISMVEELNAKGIIHPKLDNLKSLVNEILKNKPAVKIIVFANYRATVEKIKNLFRDDGLKVELFIGQATKEGKGLTQEEQIKILNDFREGKFNILSATSVGEEGLDVPAVDYAIFYEPVPSEIRMIQRRGRVGRQSAGKAIFLITKGTRDESYFWSALRKEKKMKGILYGLKENKKLDKKEKLIDWLK